MVLLVLINLWVIFKILSTVSQHKMHINFCNLLLVFIKLWIILEIEGPENWLILVKLMTDYDLLLKVSELILVFISIFIFLDFD